MNESIVAQFLFRRGVVYCFNLNDTAGKTNLQKTLHNFTGILTVTLYVAQNMSKM